jgi:hypothetical protein
MTTVVAVRAVNNACLYSVCVRVCGILLSAVPYTCTGFADVPCFTIVMPPLQCLSFLQSQTHNATRTVTAATSRLHAGNTSLPHYRCADRISRGLRPCLLTRATDFLTVCILYSTALHTPLRSTLQSPYKPGDILVGSLVCH